VLHGRGLRPRALGRQLGRRRARRGEAVFDERGRGRTYRLADDPEENNPRPLAEGAPLVQAYAAWHQRGWAIARAPSADERHALESLGYVR